MDHRFERLLQLTVGRGLGHASLHCMLVPGPQDQETDPADEAVGKPKYFRGLGAMEGEIVKTSNGLGLRLVNDMA